MKKLLWFMVMLSSCFVAGMAHTGATPRVTGLGEMGEFGSLWGEGLFPVHDMNDQVVFFDFQAEVNRFYSGNNAFSSIVSPGLGMRHAFSNENVIGLYLFSDYMMTNAHQNYWFVSPGMDFYHGPWYAALNGYIPVNNAPRTIGPVLAASDLGMTQYEVLKGNSQYDSLVQTFDSMRWGMDLTGGLLFGEKNEWGVKLGAYVYDAQHMNTIGGGRGELDYYINDSIVLMVEERYDNVFHNQALLGIRISVFGKENRGTVKTQLKAPIYRNLNINTTNAGTPIGMYQQVSSQPSLIQDNITFVSNATHLSHTQLLQSSTITGDGTYENPYTGLDQAIIDSITKNTNIWVEGTGANHPYSDANTLALHPRQAMYGRTDGFKLAASSVSTQPIFNFAPGTEIAGLYIDNTNTLQNFIMHGNGATDSRGVQVNGAGVGTARIKGVTIGTTATDNGYATALYNQGGNVSINDATLYAIKDTVTVTASGIPSAQGVFGIYNHGGTIAVNNSTVSASANRVNYDANIPVGGDFVGTFGVYNTEGTVTISDSTVQATADQVVDNRTPASAPSSMIGAFGLYNTKGTMTVTGSSSSISATATDVDNQGTFSGQGLLDYVGAFGAYNDGGGSGNTATLDVKQAVVETSATTDTSSLNNPALSAIGVWNAGNGGTATTTVEQAARVNVDANSQIASSLSSSVVSAFGLYNEGAFDSNSHEGTGYLTGNAVTVTVTETAGDNSGGEVAGVRNGSLYQAGILAQTVIDGATHISVSGTGGTINVYGFENDGNYQHTTGTIIMGGSTIDSEGGGTSGSSNAIYNTIGSMSIIGTPDQNIWLTAHGNGSGGNNGVVNNNGANMEDLSYATIAVGPTSTGYSIGISNADGPSGASTISIDQVKVDVTAPDSPQAYGVLNSSSTPGSTMTISGSTFNVTTSNNGVAYGASNSGSTAGSTPGSTMTISGSTFNVTTSGNGNVYGVNNSGSNSGSASASGATTTISGSMFNVTTSGDGGVAYGVHNSGTTSGSASASGATTTISGSTLTVTSSQNGYSYGLADGGGSFPGIVIEPGQTILELNYNASVSALSGNYIGGGNVTCYYNGAVGLCN